MQLEQGKDCQHSFPPCGKYCLGIWWLSQPCPQGALTVTWALVQVPVVLSQNMQSFFSFPPFLFFNKLNWTGRITLNVKKEASFSRVDLQLDTAQWAEHRSRGGTGGSRWSGSRSSLVGDLTRRGQGFHLTVDGDQVRLIIFPDCSQEDLFLLFCFINTLAIFYIRFAKLIVLTNSRK